MLQVQGQSSCRPLPHSQVIYVCEDVDCASNVVHKRGAQDPLAAALQSLGKPLGDSNKVTAKQVRRTCAQVELHNSAPSFPVCSSLAATTGSCNIMRQRKQHKQLKCQVALNPHQPSTNIVPCWSLQGETLKESLLVAANANARSRGDDCLSLAGLLNVLDGVVDTPGRLLVFSTNHPERLDPALIRPGRINK